MDIWSLFGDYLIVGLLKFSLVLKKSPNIPFKIPPNLKIMINWYLTGAANWETGSAIIGPAWSKEKELAGCLPKEKEYTLRGTGM